MIGRTRCQERRAGMGCVGALVQESGRGIVFGVVRGEGLRGKTGEQQKPTGNEQKIPKTECHDE